MVNKLGLILILYLLNVTTVVAQFYVRAGVGNVNILQVDNDSHFSYSRTVESYQADPLAQVSYNISKSSEPASFSTGSHMVLAVGYQITNHVGVQVDGYRTIKNGSYTSYDSSTDNWGEFFAISDTRATRHFSYVLPSVTLRNNWGKFGLEGRFGPAIPLTLDVGLTERINNVYFNLYQPPTTVNYSSTALVKDKFGLGFGAALNCSFKINKAFSMFLECNILSLSLQAKSLDSIAGPIINQGASNQIKTQPYPDPWIHILYSKIQPGQPMPYKIPYSNIGWTAGLQFSFAKTKKDKLVSTP